MLFDRRVKTPYSEELLRLHLSLEVVLSHLRKGKRLYKRQSLYSEKASIPRARLLLKPLNMNPTHQALKSSLTVRTKTSASVPKWKTVSTSRALTFLSLAHCIVDKIAGDPNCGLFCIFDGHGGRQVSDHCAERFPAEMKKELMKNPADLTKPI